MSTALDAARIYVSRNWPPVPVRGKSPFIKNWPNLRLTKEELDQHFGNGENVGVNLEAAGLVDIDLDCAEAVRLGPSFLVPTATFGPSAQPAHYIYVTGLPLESQKLSDPLRTEDAILAEFRCKGRQSVFPGSIHPDSNEPIEWTDPASIVPTLAPADLLGRTKRLAAACLLGRYWPVGRRQDAALALAGGLLRADWADEEAESFIRAVAEAAGDEETDKRIDTVASTRKAIDEGKPATGWPTLAEIVNPKIVETVREWLNVPFLPERQPVTDMANAERFVRQHGDTLRFNAQRGKWLLYDETRWGVDEEGKAVQRAKQTVLSIYQEAKEERDLVKRTRLLAHAQASEGQARLTAMLKLAESDLPILIDRLDADPWLLNVENGTLDMRELDLRPHRREDYITKLAPVTYDGRAECPLWLAFLDRVMDGQEELIRFLQQASGYALTGETREQCLFLLYGTGSNGKSTYIETLNAVLGDYARTAAFGTFLMKKHDAIPNDLARLVGVRFVSATEAARGRSFDEPVLKQVTGQDRISARFLFHEWFDFNPQFKLFLAVNHKPVIRGLDHAIWRRIRLVPFTVTIPDEEQDKDLKGKLFKERAGILNWAIQGCASWQAHGLQTPAAVQAATLDYREEMDWLGHFFEEATVLDPVAEVRAGSLYKAYMEHCTSTGERAVSQTAFGRELAARGFQRRHSGGRWWLGLRLA